MVAQAGEVLNARVDEQLRKVKEIVEKSCELAKCQQMLNSALDSIEMSPLVEPVAASSVEEAKQSIVASLRDVSEEYDSKHTLVAQCTELDSWLKAQNVNPTKYNKHAAPVNQVVERYNSTRKLIEDRSQQLYDELLKQQQVAELLSPFNNLSNQSKEFVEHQSQHLNRESVEASLEEQYQPKHVKSSRGFTQRQ